MPNKLLKVNGHLVTLADLARAWLEKETRFTNAPWSDPASNLSTEDYAKVCLIDLNEPGQEKVKSKLKLPYKSTPDGPVNRQALRAIAAALGGARQPMQAPPEAKRKAARKLVGLMRQAGLEPGPATLKLAGLEPAQKAEFEVQVDILKADEEKRLVYGVPLVPDTVDSQGDRISPEEIEQTAHQYLVKSRRYDYQHKSLIDPGKVVPVESYIAPADLDIGGKQVAKGSWVLVSKVFDPDLWQQIKTGQLNGYSIKGSGVRKPLSP